MVIMPQKSRARRWPPLLWLPLVLGACSHGTPIDDHQGGPPKSLDTAKSEIAGLADDPDATPLTKVYTAEINAPEAEFMAATPALRNLQLSLTASRNVLLEESLSADKARAQASLDRAETLFAEGQWYPVIRELNSYLNRVQVPEKVPYLRSQYLLGRAYENLQIKNRAQRAYLRYLAAASSPIDTEKPDLEDVFTRLIRLIGADSLSPKDTRAQLTAVVLDVPPLLRPRILVEAGRSALKKGLKPMAREWLSQAQKLSQDPLITAKAIYLLGLSAMMDQKWSEADDFFSQVVDLEASQELKDTARLSRARLALAQRKNTEALAFYSSISNDSVAGREATLESTYALLAGQQYDRARAKAVLYLGLWPTTPEAQDMRQLLAYLDLKSGDLDGSEQHLAASDQRLKQFASWTKTRFAGRDRIDQALLLDLIQASRDIAEPLSSVAEARKIFDRIAVYRQTLLDIHGDIHNTYFSLSQASLAEIKPLLVQKSRQLRRIAEEALTIGHRLIAADRLLYRDRLSPLLWQKLTASEARRVRLPRSMTMTYPDRSTHATVTQLMELTQKTSDLLEKLRSASAQLPAASMIDTASDGGTPKTKTEQRQSEEKKGTILANKLTQQITKLRREKVSALIAKDPLASEERLIRAYAMALKDEREILRDVENGSSRPSERLTRQEADRAWLLWEGVLKDIFSQYDSLNQSIATSLTKLLSDLEEAEAKELRLRGLLADIKDALEKSLGMNSHEIAGQYLSLVTSRASKHQKWRADIDWVRYQETLGRERALRDKHVLNQQILQDHWSDLKQGVVWTWPE